MKVLLDGRPTLGGIHRYTTELRRLLCESCSPLELFIFGQTAGIGRRLGPAGTGRPLPLVSALRQMIADQIILPCAARRSSAQIYHSPHGFLPRRLRLRTVVTCHDLWLLEGLATKPAGWKRYYDKWNFIHALQHADQIVTPSQAVADKLKARYGIDSRRVTCITPPIPKLATDLSTKIPARPYLLSVGTLEPRKNLMRLLDAQVQAFAKTRVPLYLVGPYGWRVKPILIRLAQVGAAARWLGQVEDSTLAMLYQHASALVQYSLDEGFDYPVAEGLKFGSPVVLSDIPVHKELAGELALFASPLEPAQLAQRIEEVIDWPNSRRKEHAVRARELIKRLEALGSPERYWEVYRRALF